MPRNGSRDFGFDIDRYIVAVAEQGDPGPWPSHLTNYPGLNITALHLFQILRAWRNKSQVFTVKMLLDKLREWQQKGYVSANVWESMEDVVDPILLPMREVPSSGQGETMNAMCNFVVKIWPNLCAGNPLADLCPGFPPPQTKMSLFNTVDLFESIQRNYDSSNGLFTLHGNGTGNGKRWVSILYFVL